MTAETAVVLPGLVFVLAVLLVALGAGVTHLRCVDAAAAAARVVARGDDATVARQLVQELAPGATVRFATDADTVRVEVRSPVRLPVPFLGGTPSWHTSATAVAAREEW